MSAQGRGRDSTLVHMTPREVSGLQSLAMAHGGTLTINPETGLPEAGFLDSILPTLLGGAATFFSGGTITPFMAALGVGGLTALTSKDLGKGLMAGLGAYGGAGIAGGLMNFGANAIGSEAATAALPSGASSVSGDYDLLQAQASNAAQKGASNFDKLSRGVTEGFKNPMGAFSAIGGGSKLQGAAMLGAPLLSALATQDQTSVPTAEQIKFDPRYANINISRSQRPYQPDTGSSGERRYFGNTYVTQYADGGAVSNDGIEHFAYGGGTIDPTYDYSGYGPRSNSSGMRPITSVETAKPDFVGADGKTYRYDPIKKSWYVIKEAEEKKVNAGVETLMSESPAGGENPVNTTPIANNGLFSTIWGRTTQPAAPVEDRIEDAKTMAEIVDILNGLTVSGADIKGGQFVGGPQMQAQADKDAATSASSPTATGGRANSPSGLASLAAAAAPPAGPDFDARQDEADAAAMANANAARETAAIAAAIANTTGVSLAAPTVTAGGVYVDAKNAAAAAASDAVQAAKDSADNPANSNPLGGDVTSSTPDGPSGAPPGGGDVAEGGGGNYGDSNPDSIANGGMVGRYAQGGLGSLGGYSDGGRLLRGPGDGVSDSIPATVGNRQPARLADGEFVVPARIVSELGNGSTEAGARALYKMMDRIQANRRKTTGKNRVAVNSKSHKYLPA